MSNVIDNIDINLDNVELVPPQIDNQVVEVTVIEASAYPNDGKRSGHLDIEVVLEQEVISTTGKKLPVGKKMPAISILTEPTGGMTAERIAEELGRWKAAAAGTKEVSGSFGSPSQLVGKKLKLKWKVGKTGFQNATPLLS